MTAASLPLIVSSTRSVRLRRRATSSSAEDRKSTRLNSSHSQISYAVFCLKKKKHLTEIHLIWSDLASLCCPVGGHHARVVSMRGRSIGSLVPVRCLRRCRLLCRRCLYARR